MKPTYNNKSIICSECGANRIKLKLEKLTRSECVKIAGMAAMKVLYIFEKEYPNDTHVRDAIKISDCISSVWENKEKMYDLFKKAEHTAVSNIPIYPARVATAASYVIKACFESDYVYNAYMAVMWSAMAASSDLDGYDYDVVLPKDWI